MCKVCLPQPSLQLSCSYGAVLETWAPQVAGLPPERTKKAKRKHLTQGHQIFATCPHHHVTRSKGWEFLTIL